MEEIERYNVRLSLDMNFHPMSKKLMDASDCFLSKAVNEQLQSWTKDCFKNVRVLFPQIAKRIDYLLIEREIAETEEEKHELTDHIYIHQRHMIYYLRNQLLYSLMFIPKVPEICSICLCNCVDPFVCLFCQKEIGCFECMKEYYKNTEEAYLNGDGRKCLKCFRPDIQGISTWCAGDKFFIAQGNFEHVGKEVHGYTYMSNYNIIFRSFKHESAYLSRYFIPTVTINDFEKDVYFPPTSLQYNFQSDWPCTFLITVYLPFIRLHHLPNIIDHLHTFAPQLHVYYIKFCLFYQDLTYHPELA